MKPPEIMASTTDGSSSTSGTVAPAGGLRRNLTVPAFNTSLSAEPASDGFRERKGSFDMGWLTRSVRRVSIDIPSESEAKETAGSTSTQPQLLSRQEDTKQTTSGGGMIGAPPEGSKRMERRKSDSALWKWFSTPMANERDLKGTKISEVDELAPQGKLTSIAQQMTQQSSGANQQRTSIDAGKFSVWKITKDKMATRDMNAISPSNW